MPIRPENRDRYPADWPEISRRIRFGRAGGRCECTGRCGRVHYPPGCHHLVPRCEARHGEGHPETGSKVVLTTAHLDHTPENVSPGNLLAMCQRCHLAYDRDHHAQTRMLRANARRREMGDLFEGGGV